MRVRGWQTHELSVDGGRLRKRYVSWDRGEHEREWAVLTLLARYAPGLAPAPLAADLDADPPWVMMSVLPGSPLGSGPLTADQFDALETALRRLWSVSVEDLPARRLSLAEAVRSGSAKLAAVGRPDGVAGTAYDAAMDLVTGPELAELAREEPPPVLGHSDPNLANYLWDGARIWVVDFEDAGRSDVAYELATLVEHMAARETDWTAFCARFDVDPVRLRWCRQLCAAFWLYFLLRDRGSARGNPPDVLERQARRLLDLVDDRRARMPE